MGEADRKVLKAAIKHTSGEDQVRHRQVPPEVVSKWSQKLDGMKLEISEVLTEEKEEKQVRVSVMRCPTDGCPDPCLDSSGRPRWS